jgi:biofilm PGA synthesis N-glycosyltransferase PgaC
MSSFCHILAIGGINVNKKFIISILFGVLCLAVSTYFAVRWAAYVSKYLNTAYVWWVIIGIALLPGFLMSSMFISNIINSKIKKYKDTCEPTTIIMCAFNEEKNIEKSIRCIFNQNYKGHITLLVADNRSTDRTEYLIRRAIEENPNTRCWIRYGYCRKKGKTWALNCALRHVKTKYFITVDADTFLEKNAVQRIMNNIVCEKSSCVAGNLFVQNAFSSLMTRMQIYDYLLSIAAVKRYQGSYDSTLVAQGAFSAYLTEDVRKVGGWKDVEGEDIVLTYQLLEQGCKSTYEPRAVGYTVVPRTIGRFYAQRKRWAKGMLEGFKHVRPWKQKSFYSKYFAYVNILIIYLDLAYIFGFLVGVILAFMGYYYFVGLMTLFTLIISGIFFSVMYLYQKKLGIPFKNSVTGFALFLLFYQAVQSIAALNGYTEMVLSEEKPL